MCPNPRARHLKPKRFVRAQKSDIPIFTTKSIQLPATIGCHLGKLRMVNNQQQ